MAQSARQHAQYPPLHPTPQGKLILPSLLLERLIWLEQQGLIHPKIRASVLPIIQEPYIFPEDILSEIRKDPEAWAHFNHFTASYQRIRIAYIDAARHRPEEFQKRLTNFLRKTKENKLIMGYGGIEKYYKQ